MHLMMVKSTEKMHRPRQLYMTAATKVNVAAVENLIRAFVWILLSETFNRKLCTVNIDPDHRIYGNAYEDLTYHSKESVKDVLNLCDNFTVSDAVYHESVGRYPEMCQESLYFL